MVDQTTIEFMRLVADFERTCLEWEQTMRLLPQEGFVHVTDEELLCMVERHRAAMSACESIERVCEAPKLGEIAAEHRDMILLPKLTPQEEEDLNLLRIAQQYEAGGQWLSDLEKHYQTYCFTPHGFDHYRERVQQMVIDDRAQKREALERKRAALLATLELAQDQLQLIEAIRHLVWLKARREQVHAYARYRMEPIMLERARRQSAVSSDTVEVLTGMTACRGQATGAVHIVHTEADMDAMPENAVLVIAAAHPDFTPAFARAVAVVCDTGGATSHAAIIARECKVPCVVATRHATKQLKNGQRVEVNADRGEIRIL